MKRLNIVSGEPGLPTFIVTHHWNPTRRQLPRFSHLVPAVQQFTSLKLFKQIYSRQSVVSAASGPGAAPLPERPTIVLAGFLVEELGIIRINLDACGGQDVVMVPTYPDLLYKPIEHVLVADEPSWDQPMPPQWVDGGGWSPKRTVLFCGLDAADQTAILQILEDTGIAEVLSLAIEDVHVGSNLGSVLALTLQRSHAPGEVPEDLLDLNFVDTLPELELETTAEQGEETFETAQPASVPWAQHTASAKREEVGALKAEHSPMEGHDGVDGTGSPTEQIDTVLGELDIIDRLAGKLAVEKM